MNESTTVCVPGKNNFGKNDDVPVHKTNAPDLNSIFTFQSSYVGETPAFSHSKLKLNATITAQLWNSSGVLLSSGTLSDATAGWKSISFTCPVNVFVDNEYTVSYFTSAGNYYVERNFFPKSFPLYNGINSVFKYGSMAMFPMTNFENSNYFIEPILSKDSRIRDTVYIERNSMYSDSALMHMNILDGLWNFEWQIGGLKTRFIRTFKWEWTRQEYIDGKWINK